MRLCVDWGNSFVKLGVINNGNYISNRQSIQHDQAEQSIRNLIHDYEINQGILCSVAAIPEGVREIFTQESFMIFDKNTPLPILNAYQSPDTLGLDRLAAVVGAYIPQQGVNHLVITLGTCIVYNHITERGIFRGGAISPGIDMRLKAMDQFTYALPLVSREGHYTLVGYDTESSIRSGAINGALYEVEGMINAFKSQFSDIVVTITGGDSSLLEKRIKSGIFADPNLILKGLNYIYERNAK